MEKPRTTAIASELDVLKNRIQQLEATLKVDPKPSETTEPDSGIRKDSLTAPFPPLTPSFAPGQDVPNGGRHPSFGLGSETYNHPLPPSPAPNNWNQPVQLPPLNWSRTPSTSEATLSGTTSMTTPLSSVAKPNTLLDYTSPSVEALVGVNPYASETETINLNRGYTSVHIKRSSRHLNFGPFSWLSIIKKDKVLLTIWTYLLGANNESVVSQLVQSKHPAATQQNDKSVPPNADCPTDGKTLANESDMAGEFKIFKAAPETDSKFQIMALHRDGVEDLRPYSELKSTDLEQRKTINKLSFNKSTGVSFYEGKLSQELALIDRIKVILPKQKVCWTLINRFFDLVYPYAPFIDESSFREEMSRILGPEGFSDTQIEEIKIQNRLDLPKMGTLLVLLRLTFLSLFSNRNGVNEHNMNSDDPSPDVQKVKYLLNNPVNIDAIDIAEECLEKFDIIRKSNPVVIQCAFILRIYRMFSPEDGDGTDGGDAQSYNGLLVQMAQSCGLNREPDNFEDFPMDAKSRNIGRKIWFFLIVSDLNLSLNYGSPSTINEKYYDTRLPYYKPGNENIFDVEKEKHILSALAYFEKYYPTLRRVLDMALDLRRDVKVKDLTREISEFEKILADHYGTLQDYLMPFKDDKFAYPFLKTMKCKNYMNLKRFVMNLMYHIFLYYEEKGNNEFAFFYLKKVLSGFLGEMVPGYFALIANNHINFGEVSDLILNPSIQMTMQRSNQMLIAIMCRLNLTIGRMKDSPTHDEYLEWNTNNYRIRFAKLCKLSKQLQKIIEYTTALLSRLSNRYYFAWKISKAQNFLVKLMASKSFQDASKNIKGPVLDWTLPQIECFSAITDKALRNFSKTKITRFAKDIYDEISKDSNLSFMSPSERNSDVHSELMSLEPSSVNENSDFHYLDDADVDQIWLQLASMKESDGQSGDKEGGDTDQYFDLGLFNEPTMNTFGMLPYSFGGGTD